MPGPSSTRRRPPSTGSTLTCRAPWRTALSSRLASAAVSRSASAGSGVARAGPSAVKAAAKSSRRPGIGMSASSSAASTGRRSMSTPERNSVSSAVTTRDSRAAASRVRCRRWWVPVASGGHSRRATASCASMPASGVRSAWAACATTARSWRMRCARRRPSSSIASRIGCSSTRSAGGSAVPLSIGSWCCTWAESWSSGSSSRRARRRSAVAPPTPTSSAATSVPSVTSPSASSRSSRDWAT